MNRTLLATTLLAVLNTPIGAQIDNANALESKAIIRSAKPYHALYSNIIQDKAPRTPLRFYLSPTATFSFDPCTLPGGQLNKHYFLSTCK